MHRVEKATRPTIAGDVVRDGEGLVLSLVRSLDRGDARTRPNPLGVKAIILQPVSAVSNCVTNFGGFSGVLGQAHWEPH